MTYSVLLVRSASETGGRTISKRGAGQSQKLERTRLVQIIKSKAEEIKRWHQQIAKSALGSRARSSGVSGLRIATRYMVARQQELTNLLTRYRF